MRSTFRARGAPRGKLDAGDEVLARAFFADIEARYSWDGNRHPEFRAPLADALAILRKRA